MVYRRILPLLVGLLAANILLAACASARPKAVCVVLDTAGENDKGFNQFTLAGARQAALDEGLPFAHIVTTSDEDYRPYIESFIDEGCGLIMTVGFLMATATAEAAKAHPEVHFAIMDVEYFPGFGCEATAENCYSEAGGLSNVTSLTFKEDEVGYLAGTLAGCMTETNIIGSVAGMEIPPVVRFVTGYQNGAKAVNPAVQTLNVYIPDFGDAYTGKKEGDRQIAAGADVIFGVGGNAGNGGILAARDVDHMAIGVDVDQYDTFPEVGSALLTSAMKKVDVAAADAVHKYAAGDLAEGVLLSTLAGGGVGLAPYHEWADRIPDECKAAVDRVAAGLVDGSISTGYAP